MAKTKIDWCDKVWNPIHGCMKISEGCRFCYAEKMARRLQGIPLSGYNAGFNITYRPERYKLPLKWKKPSLIFVDSMGDLFHRLIALSAIIEIFDIMRIAYWHTFLILTKRSNLMLEKSPHLNWEDNIWMGVSVENKEYIGRINDLKRSGAKHKFISFEPMLGPIPNLIENLNGINWVILGGENGQPSRPCYSPWYENVRDACDKLNIPFFFKGFGGGHKYVGKWQQFPEEMKKQ